jgi:phosphotransferase system HPr (HPr) family protein
MSFRTLIVTKPNGLHARPAVLFAQAALRHPASIRLRKGERTVDGKSVLGILTLGLKCNDVVTLEIENGDDELVAALGRLLGEEVPVR